RPATTPPAYTRTSCKLLAGITLSVAGARQTGWSGGRDGLLSWMPDDGAKLHAFAGCPCHAGTSPAYSGPVAVAISAAPGGPPQGAVDMTRRAWALGLALLPALGSAGCKARDTDTLGRICHKVGVKFEALAGGPRGHFAGSWQAVRAS